MKHLILEIVEQHQLEVLVQLHLIEVSIVPLIIL